MPQVKQRTGMIIFDAATTPPPPPPLDKKERGRVLGAKAKVSERRRLYRKERCFSYCDGPLQTHPQQNRTHCEKPKGLLLKKTILEEVTTLLLPTPP